MDTAQLEADGWSRLATKNFSTEIGATWMTGEAGNRTVGFLPDPRCNNDHGGMVHGGALMTFADIALGCGVADAAEVPFIVTTQLQYNFLAAAPLSTFITCQPEVVRKTSKLIFVRGLIKTGQRTIGSAEGIWTVLDPEKLARLKAG